MYKVYILYIIYIYILDFHISEDIFYKLSLPCFPFNSFQRSSKTKVHYSFKQLFSIPQYWHAIIYYKIFRILFFSLLH